MAEALLGLGEGDRREALLVAADRTGRPAYLLEKDVWVVWTLGALFDSSLGEHLVFKGGTSLSKAYGGLIQRFSEDIDLTHDIRKLIPDMAGAGAEPIPASRSQARKWTDVVRKRLPVWISDEVMPVLDVAIKASGLDLTLIHEGEKLRLRYAQLTEGNDYVRPEVLLEFGARSTGEPASARKVTCDAAPVLPELTFPEAVPRVMAAERTFWEKATAAHVYCLKGDFRGERYARHWHDIARLATAGIAKAAIVDHELASRVARHKQAFFAENASDGSVIDYGRAVSGDLRLIPGGDALDALKSDYQDMINSGLFEEEPSSFEELISQCRAIELETNRQVRPDRRSGIHP